MYEHVGLMTWRETGDCVLDSTCLVHALPRQVAEPASEIGLLGTLPEPCSFIRHQAKQPVMWKVQSGGISLPTQHLEDPCAAPPPLMLPKNPSNCRPKIRIKRTVCNESIIESKVIANQIRQNHRRLTTTGAIAVHLAVTPPNQNGIPTGCPYSRTEQGADGWCVTGAWPRQEEPDGTRATIFASGLRLFSSAWRGPKSISCTPDPIRPIKATLRAQFIVISFEHPFVLYKIIDQKYV